MKRLCGYYDEHSRETSFWVSISAENPWGTGQKDRCWCAVRWVKHAQLALRSVYYTVAVVAWLSQLSFKPTLIKTKWLAFIYCTQQQADPNLFGSGFVKTKVGGSLGISIKAAWGTELHGMSQQFNSTNCGPIRMLVLFSHLKGQILMSQPTILSQLTVKFRTHQPRTWQCNLLTAIEAAEPTAMLLWNFCWSKFGKPYLYLMSVPFPGQCIKKQD